MKPSYGILLLAAALVLPGSAWSQVSVSGRVMSESGPVAFATVTVEGTGLGTLTDERGAYRFPSLRPGRYTLVARAQGHSPHERAVAVPMGPPLEVDFHLRIRAVESDPIVVTGTRKEIRLSESPVKVEVLSANALRKKPAATLADAIETVNGLYQQIDCGVCYTNNIRINGLDGPYTTVLIDGAPIMSSLASVYGLSGISPALIEQVEVIKGPASTLYGSEAMAGVINVITKDARFAPLVAVESFASSDGEMNLDVALSPRTERVNLLLSTNLFRAGRFIDRNHDNFSDLPQQERLSLFGKVETLRDGRKALSLSAKYLTEDRAGGVSEWTPEHRGSDRFYGESIRTERVELVGSYRFGVAPEALSAEFSYSWHDQDSFYGSTPYMARQQIAHGTLLWNPATRESNDLLLGAALRRQSYDDDTPATATANRQWIPGVFAQNEVVFSERFRALGGLRLDHHEEHGVVLSPRLSFKWQPNAATAVRLNGGTGFRVVNLFTEDHAALTGARTVVIEEALKPERSYNATLNVNHALEIAGNPATLDVDAFYSHFTNRILPDHDTDPDLILYRNLDGFSVSRGLAATLSQSPGSLPLTYTLGGTWMQVFSDRDGVRERQLYAPSFQGVFNATYELEAAGLTFDWIGRATGPMRLPRYEEPFSRPTRSPWYTIQHLKVAKHVDVAGGDMDPYVAVQNLFDFRQPSPLVDPANPFGPHFDTAYMYAPLQGRTLVIGVRYGVPK